MTEQRGVSERWCPDCGRALAPAQTMCQACGLDFLSTIARDAEKANGELHRIMAQLDQLKDQQRMWLEYRKDVLAFAQRGATGRAAGAGERVDGEPAPHASPAAGTESLFPSPEGAPTIASAYAPHIPSAAENGFQAPEQGVAVSLEQLVPVQRGEHPAAAASPDSMRPARRLAAPVLLGIAGAALFILAGISFVAVSWSTYGPGVRMIILIAFATTFAWLARLSTKHSFASVGGALGVVSAAFVGVSVYALTAGSSGPAPYTLAVASLVSGLAGLGLSRLDIKGVGAAASGAVVFAVEAGAIEASVRAASVTEGMVRFAILGAAGGGLVFVSRRLWPSKVQRDIATYGGVTVAFAATAVALVAPLNAETPDVWVGIALAVNLVVWAGLAAWKARVAVGVVSGILTLGAVSAASMWQLAFGQLSLVYAVAAIAVVAILGLAPVEWRRPVLVGLVPGLFYVGFATLVALCVNLPLSLVDSGTNLAATSAIVGGLWWMGAALVLVAALPLVMARWQPNDPTEKGGPIAGAAVAFAAGTVFLAVDMANALVPGAVAAGMALTLAAGVQWAAARLWGSPLRVLVHAVSIGFATAGGLHGIAMIVTSEPGSPHVPWGLAAVVIALAALAVAATQVIPASGAWSFVAIGASCAWTWHVTGSYGYAFLACAAAALVITFIAARLPTGYASSIFNGSAPGYVAMGIGLLVGTQIAAVNSWGPHPSNSAPLWVIGVSACVALIGPPLATLAHRTGIDPSRRAVPVVSTVGFVVLAIALLSRVQEALAHSDGVALTVVDAVSPALAVAVGALIFGLVAAVPWWRPAHFPVLVGLIVLVSLHGVVELVRLATGGVDLWWTVAAIVFSAAALGVCAKWRPKGSLIPAIFLVTLVAPAGLVGDRPEATFASAATALALVAWSARWRRGAVRRSILIGGIGVGAVTLYALLYVTWLAALSLVHTWDGRGATWLPWNIMVMVAATAALLAWSPLRRVAGAMVAFSLVVIAGMVPAPIGWLALAMIGALSTQLAARWRVKLGLHPLVPLGLGLASVAWAAGSAGTAAVALVILSLGAIWTAIRAETAGFVRTLAVVVAPLTGATSVFLALSWWHVDHGVAATIAAGTALTMPLIAAAAGLDNQRRITVWLLALVSLCGPTLTLDPALAGLVVVMACAAWFTLSTMGVRWARWVALGGLSLAAILMAAAVGLDTIEAYTAVPALTMVCVGLWWLKRDTKVRTYLALAPGLGLALVPTYVALAVDPHTLVRPLALVLAALVLAVAGVILRWFAPLLATAVTAIVIAVMEMFVEDPIFQVWVGVAIIGAVLFALALLAERIKAMR